MAFFQARRFVWLMLLCAISLFVLYQLMFGFQFNRSQSGSKKSNGGPLSIIEVRVDDAPLDSSWSQLKFQRKKSSRIPLVVIFLGTRPEAIKLAPLIIEMRGRSNLETIVVSTGQHREMLDQSLAAFSLQPDFDLRLMRPNQDLQQLFTSAFDATHHTLLQLSPQMVVVQGDTTTALAAAMAASHLKIPVAHVEAGLRTFDTNNPFPEEMNRKLIDGVSALHLAPTEFAAEVLRREISCHDSISVTGNTVVDALHIRLKQPVPQNDSVLSWVQQHNEKRDMLRSSGSQFPLTILVTSHRRENFGSPLRAICQAIKKIVERNRGTSRPITVLFPVHLNPNVQTTVREQLGNVDGIELVQPLSYEVFPFILREVDVVLTDSGGIQEEAVSIGKPVVLLRQVTERAEGVFLGTIRVAGTDARAIVSETQAIIDNFDSIQQKAHESHIFGYGNSSRIITDLIVRYLSKPQTSSPSCTSQALQKDISERSSTGSNRPSAPTIVTNIKDTIPIDRISVSQVKSRLLPLKERVERAIKEAAPKSPRTFSDVLAMPSKFRNQLPADQATVTAIISLYRRSQYVDRMVDALLKQSHPPKEIWIAIFASPIQEELVAAVKRIQLQRGANAVPPIHLITGDVQLSYFGRFQLGIQAKTKYAAFIDDDCIPGSRFFEINLHAINTDEYNGILGVKGHLGSPVPKDVFEMFYRPLFREDHMREVDVVGGTWFLETEHVKLLFRDKLYSWKTGEDVQLCAHARKYANLRCFDLPKDLNDPSTWGYSTDYIKISESGDTTLYLPGLKEERETVMTNLWLRGDRRTYCSHYFGQRSSSSALLFGENLHTVQRLAGVLFGVQALAQKAHSEKRVAHKYVTLLGRDKEPIDYAYLKKEMGAEEVFDLQSGRDFIRNERAIDLAADALYHFSTLLDCLIPGIIFVDGSRGDAGTLGAVVAATQKGNSCIINLQNVDPSAERASVELLDPIATAKSASMITDLAHVTVYYDSRELAANDAAFLARVNAAVQICLA